MEVNVLFKGFLFFLFIEIVVSGMGKTQVCNEAFLVVTKCLTLFFCFRRDHKMALLQMATVEEAIQALIDLHNYNLGENHHLRVSFSKSTI